MRGRTHGQKDSVQCGPAGLGIGSGCGAVEARHLPNQPAAGQVMGQGASKMHQEEVRVKGTSGSSFSERMDENRVSMARIKRF